MMLSSALEADETRSRKRTHEERSPREAPVPDCPVDDRCAKRSKSLEDDGEVCSPSRAHALGFQLPGRGFGGDERPPRSLGSSWSVSMPLVSSSHWGQVFDNSLSPSPPSGPPPASTLHDVSLSLDSADVPPILGIRDRSRSGELPPPVVRSRIAQQLSTGPRVLHRELRAVAEVESDDDDDADDDGSVHSLDFGGPASPMVPSDPIAAAGPAGGASMDETMEFSVKEAASSMPMMHKALQALRIQDSSTFTNEVHPRLRPRGVSAAAAAGIAVMDMDWPMAASWHGSAGLPVVRRGGAAAAAAPAAASEWDRSLPAFLPTVRPRARPL